VTQIIFENEDFLLANKPSGFAIASSKTTETNLLESLKRDHHRNVLLTHRMDQVTSGLVLFAKHKQSQRAINNLFATKQIEKKYIAMVKNPLSKNTNKLKHFHRRNGRTHKAIISRTDGPGMKPSILKYDLVGKSDNYFLYTIDLETGRFHQIRAQLANEGSPIKGDVKYGARRKNPDRSIGLHCFRISFILKDEKYSFNCAPPEKNEWNAFTFVQELRK
jgi:23S rRNA pseudouridine1911/1915/1917 synthase